MPRPTKSQIDAEIVDRAAGLFARHGFANTSLQQIADAVSYSKAGLLHHYPSKQAIYAAALTTGRDHLQALLLSVEGLPRGIERDRAVVEASVDFAFDWPGLSAFRTRLSDDEEGADPDLTEMSALLCAMLGIEPALEPASTHAERTVRVTSAFAGLGIAALAAARTGLQREWRGSIVASTMDALGHGGDGSDALQPPGARARKKAATGS